MTNLPLRTFQQIVADQTATLAASLSANSSTFDTLNLTPGSPLLALMEANGGLVLFMQYLNWNVLRSTRMATSIGADLDSFGADFLFARYPAVPATGQVVFTRSTATNTAFIPINTLIRSKDGIQSFSVIGPSSDTLNLYSTDKGYVMNPSVYSISCLVQAVTPGTIGNIPANYVKPQGGLAITSVNNPSSFYNGQDTESDAQFISRFRLYINSLSRATPQAIEYAIINTNPAYTFSIMENFIATGVPQPGALLINFDNGTGLSLNPAASQILVNELQANVNDVRAAGITPFVQPAASALVSVDMDILFANTASYLASVSYIQNAVTSYINALAVGQNLYVSRLSQIIYDSTTAVINAFNVTISAIDQSGKFLPMSAHGDIMITNGQVLRFIPSPPQVNGVSSGTPSTITINPSFADA